MNAENRCQGCGNPLPQGALKGLCPVCLLREGLGRESSLSGRETGPHMSVTRSASTTSPLAPVADSIGGMPHILLRDSEIGEAPGPMVQPASTEMPAADERLGAAATARRDRPRRHGCRPQGPRPGPRPRPGGQGPPGVAPRQSRPGPPLRRGGPDRRPVAAPGDRPDLRAGSLRRPPAVFRHEAGERPDALEPPGREAGPSPRPAPLPLDLRGGLPDDGLRPRPRRDPPRPEAVEHHGRLVRRGPGDGLGTRQGLAAGRRGRRRLGRQVAGSRYGDRHGAERIPTRDHPRPAA